MATRVHTGKISMTMLKLPDHKNPVFGARFSAISLTEAKLWPVLCIFRYNGNKGLSGLNFNGTVKLPDLENLLVGARFSAQISRVIANFVSKIPTFSLPWQQGSTWTKFSVASLNCSTSKTPSLLQGSLPYLLCNLSCSHFCLQKPPD